MGQVVSETTTTGLLEFGTVQPSCLCSYRGFRNFGKNISVQLAHELPSTFWDPRGYERRSMRLHAFPHQSFTA